MITYVDKYYNLFFFLYKILGMKFDSMRIHDHFNVILVCIHQSHIWNSIQSTSALDTSIQGLHLSSTEILKPIETLTRSSLLRSAYITTAFLHTALKLQVTSNTVISKNLQSPLLSWYIRETFDRSSCSNLSRQVSPVESSDSHKKVYSRGVSILLSVCVPWQRSPLRSWPHRAVWAYLPGRPSGSWKPRCRWERLLWSWLRALLYLILFF